MTTEHGFWISAKNFFFRWPVSVSAQGTDKNERKLIRTTSAKNLQSQQAQMLSDSTYYMNSFGSLNLP